MQKLIINFMVQTLKITQKTKSFLRYLTNPNEANATFSRAFFVFRRPLEFLKSS